MYRDARLNTFQSILINAVVYRYRVYIKFHLYRDARRKRVRMGSTAVRNRKLSENTTIDIKRDTRKTWREKRGVNDAQLTKEMV